MIKRLAAMLMLWLAALALPAVARPGLAEKVAVASRAQAAAIAANDVDARLRLYRSGARSMPDHQPTLNGHAQIERYHRAMLARRRVTRYRQSTGEIFELGDTAVEFGTFTIAWRLAGGGVEKERGKYANVWAIEPDGTLRLKADTWGYFRPQPDPGHSTSSFPLNRAPACAPRPRRRPGSPGLCGGRMR